MPPLFPATMIETVAPVSVQTRKPSVIAPPLVGPNWLDGNSCCDMTPHRMALNPTQRAAVGRRTVRDRLRAAAARRPTVQRRQDQAGELSRFRRRHPRGGRRSGRRGSRRAARAGARTEPRPVCRSSNTAATTSCRTSATATMRSTRTSRPAASKSRSATRLSSGQVIASLGNTGNTDAPHLHFHVMSTPDPLRSNGLPFVLSSFRLDGRIASMDVEDRSRSRPAGADAAGLHPSR